MSVAWSFYLELYSECGSWPSIIAITWGLVRDADSQIPTSDLLHHNLHMTSPQGIRMHSSLRSTASAYGNVAGQQVADEEGPSIHHTPQLATGSA